MLIAGSVELALALSKLARHRQVFHSEVDFQFALAWQIKTEDPAIQVALETRPAEGMHLDLAFRKGDRHYTAIELKYLTRAWSGVDLSGEEYNLKNHSARDYGRYGVVKDITRVERFLHDRVDGNGAVVALTNDPTYISSRDGSTAIDADFDISDGAVLRGTRAWRRAPASVERQEALELEFQYEMRWADFSEPTAEPRLWLLVVEVPGLPSELCSQ